MQFRPRRRFTKIAIASTATVCVVSGAAYATGLTTSAGTIRACASQRDGALGAVAPAPNSGGGDGRLRGTAAARPGTAGPAGPRGPPGPRGTHAPPGRPG